jgi:hypothetical protein
MWNRLSTATSVSLASIAIAAIVLGLALLAADPAFGQSGGGGGCGLANCTMSEGYAVPPPCDGRECMGIQCLEECFCDLDGLADCKCRHPIIGG